jgi:hypothetical protein
MEKDQNKSNRFVKGHSWGDINLKQKDVQFTNKDQWFNIPYKTISNVHLPSKNEIGLEFIPEDLGDLK